MDGWTRTLQSVRSLQLNPASCCCEIPSVLLTLMLHRIMACKSQGRKIVESPCSFCVCLWRRIMHIHPSQNLWFARSHGKLRADAPQRRSSYWFSQTWLWLPLKTHLKNGFVTADGTIQFNCIDFFFDISNNAELLKKESHTHSLTKELLCNTTVQTQVSVWLQWSSCEAGTPHKGTFAPVTDAVCYKKLTCIYRFAAQWKGLKLISG